MDEGLFEDSAVIRRVAGEGLLLAGGGRATLLQIAHPAVAQGVLDHSSFADRPLDRLRTTMSYVYGVLYGTRAEAQTISRAVAAMHSKVTGPGYTANDPALQVWVNATLFDTAMLLYERVLGPLPPAEADVCYQQYSVLATAIGCPESAWPADRAAFSAYWDHMIATIEVNDSGRRIANTLLWPEGLPVALRPAVPSTVSSPSACCRPRSGTASDCRGRRAARNSSTGCCRAPRPSIRGCRGGCATPLRISTCATTASACPVAGTRWLRAERTPRGGALSARLSPSVASALGWSDSVASLAPSHIARHSQGDAGDGHDRSCAEHGHDRGTGRRQVGVIIRARVDAVLAAGNGGDVHPQRERLTVRVDTRGDDRMVTRCEPRRQADRDAGDAVTVSNTGAENAARSRR